MVYEIIMEGLGQTVGYSYIIFLIFLLSFLVALISRGLGISAMLGATLLTVYLFRTERLAGVPHLVPEGWFIAIIIIVGLFIGWIFASYFFQ